MSEKVSLYKKSDKSDNLLLDITAIVQKAKGPVFIFAPIIIIVRFLFFYAYSYKNYLIFTVIIYYLYILIFTVILACVLLHSCFKRFFKSLIIIPYLGEKQNYQLVYLDYRKQFFCCKLFHLYLFSPTNKTSLPILYNI